MAMALPEAFRVVRLTREELREQCKLDDFAQWGAPALDLAQYQQKERLQRQTRFSQRGSIFWALVERSTGAQATNDGGGDDDESDAALEPGRDRIVCHCESHRFDCALRSRSGAVARGHSLHIASVFTLPAFRRRGLAAHFLSEVARRIRSLPGALVSVLYSDIGPAYYDRLGWRLHPSTAATLDVDHPRNVAAAEAPAALQEEEEVLKLDERLDELLAADSERLVTELGSGREDGEEAFAVLPTRDSVEWQFCVGVHFARVRGLAELPSTCGARLQGADAFAVWTHNFKESTLYITRARFGAQDGAAAVQLLSAALKEARRFKLRKICVWDPPAVLRADSVAARMQVAFGEREDSLSSAMVLSHAAPSTTEETAATPLPTWVGNEKYAWV